jgi:hypothetical protein
MEVSGQFHAPTALPPRKETPYPLHKRRGGPQSRSGHGVEEKNSQPSPGIEPRLSGRLARSLVAIPSDLSQLLRISEVQARMSTFKNLLTGGAQILLI